MPLAFSVVIFIIAIVVGIIVGSLNAFLISRLGVPPILATLGVNELLTGLCVVMTNGSAISSFPKQYCEFFLQEICLDSFREDSWCLLLLQ